MFKEPVFPVEFSPTRLLRARPRPMGGGRVSLRNWLLPALSEFSGLVTERAQRRFRPQA